MLTIKATFSEPIKRQVDTPSLTIDYNDPFDIYDVEDTLLIANENFSDSTVWYIQTVIPASQQISGIAAISLSAKDRAGNLIDFGDISYFFYFIH